MFYWINSFKKATTETKSLILVTGLFGLVLLVTTLYCYVRLDYVRSYKHPLPTLTIKPPLI